MEEESTTDTVEETVDTSTSTTLPESSDMVVRQLMKLPFQDKIILQL